MASTGQASVGMAGLDSFGMEGIGMAGKAGWGQETIGKARQERLVLSWKGEMEEAQATMFRDPPRAVFSDDRRYRYRLWRGVEGAWSERRKALMIGLNPSVADENVLDRRCAGSSASVGCGGSAGWKW
jgi:hypothetical protein